MPGIKFGGAKAKKKVKEDGDLLSLASGKDEGLLLSPSDSWSEVWKGMPTYEMGSTEAFRKVTIHLRDPGELEDLSRMLGIDLTDRTSTVYLSRDEDYVAPKELIYESDDPRPPRYPVYVISKGRWDTPLTAEALRAIGVPHKVVIEPSEASRYEEALGKERLLVAPEDFSKRGEGGIPVRNFVWETAVASGAKRHWILDDNIHGFLRLNRNRRIPVSGPSIFRAAEDFSDRYENVALSGFNYMYLARDNQELPPFCLNTRIYSMILINHDLDLPERWRGRYNEDTDLSLRALKAGWATVLFNAFLGDKAPTLTMKGGNAEIYADSDRRREFAESLKAQHPDVVEVVWRYERWHHEVNYRPFAGNRLIPRKDQPVSAGEYGMRIARSSRTGRYVPPPLAPVVITMAPRKAEALPKEPVEIKEEPPLSSVSLTPRSSKPENAAPVVFAPRAAKTTMLSAPEANRYVDPFLRSIEPQLKVWDTELYPPKFDYATWPWGDKSFVVADVEVFENFFLVAVKRLQDGKRLTFELSDRSPKLNRIELETVMLNNCIVTFNGNNFDLPIIGMALLGFDNRKLKEASNRIIREGIKSWDIEREFGVRLPKFNSIDLMEPNPSVRMGLKMLHARLNGRFIVDLPFEDVELSSREMNVATLYCLNDLDATEGLCNALREPLDLRRALSGQYGMDLRSKSDAQVGEAIVKSRVGIRGNPKDGIPSIQSFGYSVPSFVSFESPALREVLRSLRETTFHINGSGRVETPDWLKDLSIPLGSAAYTMGIGGLHSTEGSRAILSDEENVLVDIDVSSQYPRIILKLGLYPKALGPKFLDVYRELTDERVAAKAAGDKTKADGGKIALNGVYGKLGSSYSILYAPDLMIATTLTGQLSLLMLIERLEAAGIPVASGNTDGVLPFVKRSKLKELASIVSRWEAETGFAIERTEYDAIYNSSVNSYIAVKPGGKTKIKGPLANPWREGNLREMLSKNPQMTILSDALVDLIVKGTPVEETITNAADPRAFVTVIQVRGGAEWRGAKLGRVARYYYSFDGDPILDAKGKRQVAKTEGAKPLMELTASLPEDVDRLRYFEEAKALAVDYAILKPEGELAEDSCCVIPFV